MSPENTRNQEKYFGVTTLHNVRPAIYTEIMQIIKVS